MHIDVFFHGFLPHMVSSFSDQGSQVLDRNSPSEVFLGIGVPKICSKFTGGHPCRNAISIKLLSNFIEIALWYECSIVTMLDIFRKPFPKSTFVGLVLFRI